MRVVEKEVFSRDLSVVVKKGEIMVYLQTKIYKPLIPSFCPKCESKLHHVNALDTNAEIYMIFCTNPKCKYCEDWRKTEL